VTDNHRHPVTDNRPAAPNHPVADNQAVAEARRGAVLDGDPRVWCDHCGRPTADGVHAGCAAARALEPPRFCPACRRRMKVQVLPAGWSAVCVAHGELRS